MNVLVIPEDFRKDQYVLKPLITALMEAIGKKTARVRVCQDPLMGGIVEALKPARLREVIGMYPMVQLFILVVDRDAVDARRGRIAQIEDEVDDALQDGQELIGENAWQEVEVWALAGQRLPSTWKWTDVRLEQHPKETYFRPYSRLRELEDEPGEGRKTLGREAAARYSRVRNRCPELADLETRAKAFTRRIQAKKVLKRLEKNED